MNQSLFKPRALLLATALSAAGVVGAQSTYAPSAQHDGSLPPASSISLPMQRHGRRRVERVPQEQSGARAPAGRAPRPADMQQIGAHGCAWAAARRMTAAHRQCRGSSAEMSPKAAAKPKAASADSNPTPVASAAPRNTARTPNKTAANSNPAHNRFRAELRNCVQQSGDQRENCLDRAIENHQQS